MSTNSVNEMLDELTKSIPVGKDLQVQLLKYIQVFFQSNLYLVFGCILAIILKKYIITPYKKDKSKFENSVKLIFEIGIMGIGLVIIREIIKYLPNPLYGISGYNISNFKPTTCSPFILFGLIIMLFPIYNTKLYNLQLENVNKSKSNIVLSELNNKNYKDLNSLLNNNDKKMDIKKIVSNKSPTNSFKNWLYRQNKV